ncbi:MAG: hypothetical protein VR68_06840 [Peptococcaceae bacterium BRH_c4a]|nr:MAG: hypothetical protein VR68_06840 [Peptococcaceae bacterium BRH_c4a]
MTVCKNCKSFFAASEDADKEVKSECIREMVDHKGKFWLSQPVDGNSSAKDCKKFTPKLNVQ